MHPLDLCPKGGLGYVIPHHSTASPPRAGVSIASLKHTCPIMLELEHCINQLCPRSGKPVVANSLALYRDRVVGFCNPGCRDDFAANPEECPSDRAFFDGFITENSSEN